MINYVRVGCILDGTAIKRNESEERNQEVSEQQAETVKNKDILTTKENMEKGICINLVSIYKILAMYHHAFTTMATIVCLVYPKLFCSCVWSSQHVY